MPKDEEIHIVCKVRSKEGYETLVRKYQQAADVHLKNPRLPQLSEKLLPLYVGQPQLMCGRKLVSLGGASNVEKENPDCLL